MADAPFSLLHAAARTDRGRVRPRNEDAFLCEPASGVFAVADGIGGLKGGDVASRTTVDFLRAALVSVPPAPVLEQIQRCREALNGASAWIREYAAREGYPGMGATVAALLFDPTRPGEAAAVHAGDSRVYRFREGVLEQLTHDHSAASMAGLPPDQAIPSIYQGVITRAVGVRRTVEADVTPVSVREGDLFLLCTDGLYNSVPRDRLAHVLSEPVEPEILAGRLLAEALEEGGEDNITFILARYGSIPPAPEGQPSLNRSEGRRLTPRFLWFVIPLFVIGAVWFVQHQKNGPAVVVDRVTPVSESDDGPFPIAGGAFTEETSGEESAGLPTEREETTERGMVWEETETFIRRLWLEERFAAESDMEAVKRRHVRVRNAFLWLERWSGEPLPVPSLMLAGSPEKRAEGWVEYLREAQRRWLVRAREALARQKEECETLRPERVRFLYQWVREGGSGRDPAEWNRYMEAWTQWQKELEMVAAGLGELSEDRPFLSQEKVLSWVGDLPQGPAAVRVWDLCWPWMDQVWRRYEYWRGKMEADHQHKELDRLTREANAIWGEYAARNVSMATWRRVAPLEPIRKFLDELGRFFPEELAAGPVGAEGGKAGE